uniref:Uncharacterized protein n=2 Tax=Octopus bimaculoides TaxID=37653 RepID=A0A0L8IDA4_OCTBM
MSYIDKVDNWDVTSVRKETDSVITSERSKKRGKHSKSKKSVTNSTYTHNFEPPLPPSSSDFHFQNPQLPEVESTSNHSYRPNNEKQLNSKDKKNSGNSAIQKPNLSTFKSPPSTPPPSKSERVNSANPYIVPVETSVRSQPVAIQTRCETAENPGWAKQKYKKCVEKVTENPFRISKGCCSEWMKHWWWVVLLLLLSVIGIIIGTILALVPLKSNHED